MSILNVDHVRLFYLFLKFFKGQEVEGVEGGGELKKERVRVRLWHKKQPKPDVGH